MESQEPVGSAELASRWRFNAAATRTVTSISSIHREARTPPSSPKPSWGKVSWSEALGFPWGGFEILPQGRGPCRPMELRSLEGCLALAGHMGTPVAICHTPRSTKATYQML